MAEYSDVSANLRPELLKAVHFIFREQCNLQPDWREKYEEARTWDLIRDIPDQELWEAHRRRKRRLISFVRERMENLFQFRCRKIGKS